MKRELKPSPRPVAKASSQQSHVPSPGMHALQEHKAGGCFPRLTSWSGFVLKQCSRGLCSLSPSAVIPEGACCRDEEHRGENCLFSDYKQSLFLQLCWRRGGRVPLAELKSLHWRSSFLKCIWSMLEVQLSA